MHITPSTPAAVTSGSPAPAHPPPPLHPSSPLLCQNGLHSPLPPVFQKVRSNPCPPSSVSYVPVSALPNALLTFSANSRLARVFRLRQGVRHSRLAARRDMAHETISPTCTRAERAACVVRGRVFKFTRRL